MRLQIYAIMAIAGGINGTSTENVENNWNNLNEQTCVTCMSPCGTSSAHVGESPYKGIIYTKFVFKSIKYYFV